MRPIILAFLLSAVAPAWAAEPAAPVEPVPASSPSSVQDPARADVDRHCLRETGTRIRPRAGRRDCAPYAGRVWTRDDLDRTGQTDIGNALRMLDVSIR